MTNRNTSTAGDSAIAPSQNCFEVMPHDTAELETMTKALFVGTGGDVTVRPARSQQDVTFRNLPDAYVLDVRVIAVRATGTTATDIVGLA